MSFKKNIKILMVSFVFFLVFADSISAQDEVCEECFVTIVNPVRSSTYTKDLNGNIYAQYAILKERNLPATWLMDYKVLSNESVVEIVKQIKKDHEIGILLEVTPELAGTAGVEYNNTGFWHHATSIFLSGYLKEDRIKLIDTVFGKFFNVFGYYPTAVGSWWTDSYSLDYMKNKYGIVANLTCADQFATDGYQIWGQYWSTPFYPAKLHAGIPAQSAEQKIGVVTIQWAPRDPYNGYKSSLFSTQDYFVSPVNQDIDYFNKLVELYGQKHANRFAQITLGLESDLDPLAYDKSYKQQMILVSDFVKAEKIKAVTMSDFALWYSNNFPDISPVSIIESDDLMETPVKVYWYQSPFYRINLVYDKEKEKLIVKDLRVYNDQFKEPYYNIPNKSFNLSIYIPSIFDDQGYEKDYWEIDTGNLLATNISGENLELVFEGDKKIIFKKDNFLFFNKGNKLPEIFNNYAYLDVGKSKDNFTISIIKNKMSDNDLLVKGLTIEAKYQLKRRRVKFYLFLSAVFLIGTIAFITKIKIKKSVKTVILLLIVLAGVTTVRMWVEKNSTNYFVSQAEVDALEKLRSYPKGKVLVKDSDCLWCSWHTAVKPSVFSNNREYVADLSNKPILYDRSVFEAKNPQEVGEIFKNTKAEYIYLVDYEDYFEKIPFSPGDLGIEKIYQNSNAQIWRKKNI